MTEIRRERILIEKNLFDAELQYFEENDIGLLRELYSHWRDLKFGLGKIGSRHPNLPEEYLRGPLRCSLTRQESSALPEHPARLTTTIQKATSEFRSRRLRLKPTLLRSDPSRCGTSCTFLTFTETASLTARSTCTKFQTISFTDIRSAEQKALQSNKSRAEGQDFQ